MINSRLFTVLRSFNPQEIQRFQAFIRSPYFNTDEQLIALFELLRPYLHSRSHAVVSYEIIWNNLFPGKKWKLTRFHKLTYRLLQLCFEFLRIREMEHDAITRNTGTVASLAKRKLTNEIKPLLKRTAAQMELTKPTAGYFQHALQLQLAINNYQEQLQKRDEERNLPQLLQAIDEHYLFLKLKYWCAALHYQKASGQQTFIWLQEELMPLLNDKSITANPILHLYSVILKMLLYTNEDSHYEKVKHLLVQKNLQDQAVKKEAYLYLINHCIRQVNKGFTPYNHELFSIYQYTLKQQLIAAPDYISPWDFKNIVTAALHVKELKWTEKFIKEYGRLLPLHEQANAITYNLAKVFFMRKEYSRCLQQLQQIEYSDPFYQLGAKLTQAKSLYELDEFDTLGDLLISFKKLIRQKKLLSNEHRVTYVNFIHYLQLICKATPAKNAKRILSDLQQQTEIVDKAWLEEKLLELI